MSAFDPADPAGPLFRDAVSSRVDLFFDQIARDLQGLAPESSSLVNDLVDLGRRFTAGGKRLRPAFCYWGHVAVAGQTGDRLPLLDATVGFELLHVAALIHDDLIDDSDTRRGMPAAHRQLEAMHRDAGGSGDSAAFGRSGAIILGDLMTAWSTQCFAAAGLPARAFERSRWVLDAVRTEVNLGQFLDLAAEGGLSGDDLLGTAEQVVEYKTARYTVIRPLQFGAALAGARQGLLDQLAAVGSAVGRAFQFRDDLLGVFGDEELTGKPAGDDLRENKRTVLVVDALRHVPELADYLGRPLTGQQLDDARALLIDSGSVARLNARIDADSATALELLAGLDITPEGREALESLIHVSVDRQF